MSPEEQKERKEEFQPPYVASRNSRFSIAMYPQDPDWPDTVDMLHRFQEALALIRDGANRSGMGLAAGFPEDYAPEDREFLELNVIPEEEAKPFTHPDKNLISVLLPHVGKVRLMARLLAADVRLAMIEGDDQRAYDNLIAIQGLADHCLETPCLIGELVGLAIRSIGYEVTSEVLTQHSDLLTDDQLHDLAHQYAGADLSLAYGTNGEKQWFYDLIQRIYTDEGNGDGRLTPEGIKLLRSITGSYSNEFDAVTSQELGAALGPAVMIATASRKELTDRYEQMLEAYAGEASKPLWEMPSLHVIDDQIDSWSKLEQFKYAMIATLIPAMDAVRRTGETKRGECDGVLIGIALELYRRHNGDWPNGLDALAPQYLPRLPVDRLTGKPLWYRITAEGPVVYSVGVDGDDDGGQLQINPMTGEADYERASASQYHGEYRTEPEYDGDWVLWPVVHH